MLGSCRLRGGGRGWGGLRHGWWGRGRERRLSFILQLGQYFRLIKCLVWWNKFCNAMIVNICISLLWSKESGISVFEVVLINRVWKESKIRFYFLALLDCQQHGSPFPSLVTRWIINWLYLRNWSRIENLFLFTRCDYIIFWCSLLPLQQGSTIMWLLVHCSERVERMTIYWCAVATDGHSNYDIDTMGKTDCMQSIW